jgi:uncharacterized protein involved in exopolysaccharide biosynthesis
LSRALAGLNPIERTVVNSSGQNTSSVASTSEAGRGATTTVNDTTIGSAENRETVAPNRVYQEVHRDSVTLAAQIAGLEAKRSALTAAISDRARIGSEIAGHAERINALELERSSAHGIFTAIRSSYETAVVNDARGAQEVSLVDAATRPVYPDRPLRYLFALLGVAFGLAGGVGLALLFERWSPVWTLGIQRSPVPARLALSNSSQNGFSLGTAQVSTRMPRPSRRYEI